MTDNGHVELVAHIVGAYVEKNAVQASQLPDLIASVGASIASLGRPSEPAAEKLVPAVNPKKSVFPDYLVCLDNGRKFKSLRRHLATLGMTPDEYREKWGLPRDYPMTSPNYSAARSQLAKATGLGRKAPPKAPAKPKKSSSRTRKAST